jgi:hypothetical protein
MEFDRKFKSYEKALLLWCIDDPRSLIELSIHKSRSKHLNKRKQFILTQKEKEYITKIGLIKVREDVTEYINKIIKRPVKTDKLDFCNNHPVMPAKFATGLCCRQCMSECFKIKEYVILTDEQEIKLVLVIMKWIQSQC